MKIFRVSFHDKGRVYQLHAEQVRQADLPGFVEIAGLVFNELAHLVIDPSEERLQDEFQGVSRFLVPMHAVIRVDEVERRNENQNRILDTDGTPANIMPFPFPSPATPPGGGKTP